MSLKEEADGALADKKSDMTRMGLTLVLLSVIVGGSAMLSFALVEHRRLAFYLCAMSAFHSLEFIMTLRHHPDAVTFQSFLLDHSHAYTVSVIAAVSEYTLMHCLWPNMHSFGFFMLFGILSVLVGQVFRTWAMEEAGSAFTHEVADEKMADHKLITTGIYRYIRHPSYSGYYLWSCGTQFMLGNPICTLIYLAVLYQFFSERITIEEVHLREFFPDYSAYATSCWSGIPFFGRLDLMDKFDWLKRKLVGQHRND